MILVLKSCLYHCYATVVIMLVLLYDVNLTLIILNCANIAALFYFVELYKYCNIVKWY